MRLTYPTLIWIITYVRNKLILNSLNATDDVTGTFLYIAPNWALFEAREMAVISLWASELNSGVMNYLHGWNSYYYDLMCVCIKWMSSGVIILVNYTRKFTEVSFELHSHV
jgi:hypothetical protein